MDAFHIALAADAAKIEARLSALLSHTARFGQDRLNEAMRYAVLGAGKRIRPFLVLQTAALFKVDETIALNIAASLECVHCYSLIHDDLPSMDDDDLRRGKPSLHKQFDEATAILAGDALLTLAFELIATSGAVPEIALQLVNELAKASGTQGMAGGQMRDLAAEGRFAGGTPLPLIEQDILELQAQKTGALLRYACRSGAILGNASAGDLQKITTYGEQLGSLFQLVDDLIDATGTVAQAGKAVAKDSAKGKATLVSLLGIKVAQARATQICEEAKDILAGLKKMDVLAALPDFLLSQSV